MCVLLDYITIIIFVNKRRKNIGKLFSDISHSDTEFNFSITASPGTSNSDFFKPVILESTCADTAGLSKKSF